MYNFLVETDSETEDRGDICDDDYGEVADNRLPNIILDHKKESSQSHPLTNRDGRDHFPDILNNVRDNTQQRTVIPVIIINDTSTALSDDDEMEDYYDNHKEWPPGLVR